MRRDRDLLTQVLGVNLLLIVAAVVAATLAGTQEIDIASHPQGAIILALAVALTVLVNLILLRRRFKPLEELVDEMERADLSRPGANLPERAPSGAPDEVERLHRTFRRMLDRLDTERRRTSSAALAAQEEERARIARDLHDEVNQSLTGLLLRLEAVRAHAPPELAEEIIETKALANQAMEELLTLARRLRPTSLDDLGLKAAIAGNASELDRRSALDVSFDSEGSFNDMAKNAQLVAYRVAQEAMSNAQQHAEAKAIEVHLRRTGDTVELIVSDDGKGFTFEQASSGLGLGGMRERALLVGGDVRIESRPGEGTRVWLEVPIGEDDGDGRNYSWHAGDSPDATPGDGIWR